MNTHKLYYIVVAQYKRDDFDVGAEENFHWALFVLEGIDDRAVSVSSPCYQVFDRHYHDGRVEWVLFHRHAVLDKTGKWLGGVVIGRVKESELATLDKVCSTFGMTGAVIHYNLVS